MKVFVLGGGGREHSLGYRLAQSADVDGLFFLPGNGGTARLGENLPISPTDVDAVLAAAKEHKPGLVVVGPEAPLFAGISDRLTQEGFRVLGPSTKAAMLEQEKVFAKEFMQRHHIPAASFKVFTDIASAKHYVEGKDSPLVVKASGPALGKGVIVCSTPEEALAAVDKMMAERKFGRAGDRVVVEERLVGEEVSILILTDGINYISFPPVQDHKPIGERDTGPNTGGMGAYAPAPLVDAALAERIEKEIIQPVLDGLRDEDIRYQGALYMGLMVTQEGPKVLEFNCRFGDPENQPLMMLTDEDLLGLLMDTARGRLRTRRIKTRPGSALCVVAASEGYPGSYEKGKRIRLDVEENSDLVCFHAGTRAQEGKLLTSGGRVLGVTAFASDLKKAKERAYAPLEHKKIYFDGIYFRRDIGDKGIRRLA
ncbi:phosphoribosylamine--glycine ligase [candidate division WOR-3 bacterium]|nr:phosphoribosylamine--glycine ligase [candidate division WOR-3 bacterium]